MVFIPVMCQENFWAPNCRGRRAVPQQSVVNDITEDVLNSIAIAQALLGREHDRTYPEAHGVNSSMLQRSGSSVTVDEHKFQANFDVQHFKPDEITVKVNTDRSITIEAKHEEKADEHGHIFRHFVRKYVLPENCDIAKVESKLSTDGVLCITAPTISDKAVQERTIPIIRTGQPVKSVEKLPVENKSD